MGNGSRHLLVIVLLILRRRSVGQIAILQMTSRRLCPRWFRIDNLPSIRRTSRAILDSRSEPHLISQHLAHPAPCRSSAKRFGLACLVDAEAYGQTNDPADHRPAPLERDRVTRTLCGACGCSSSSGRATMLRYVPFLPCLIHPANRYYSPRMVTSPL